MSEVDDLLRRLGASDEEIGRAKEVDALGYLAVVHAALPGTPTFTSDELAEQAGIDPELGRRLWRALGFAQVAPDERVFTEADARALATVRALLTSGIADVEEAVQMTRVVGSSMNRVAEAMISGGRTMPRLGSADETAMLAAAAEALLDTQARLLEYVWRRHLAAAGRRALLARLAPGGGGGQVAIGFADLVGFTAMSQQMEPAELARVVARFEELAFEQVAEHGGRVAKMIGDEVMFAVHDVGAAVVTGLALAEAYADDAVLNDVRVGIACGEVLAYEGDYYGPVVNVASRIVNIALPGSLVVSPSVREALAGDDRFDFHALRPRYLKDIGRVHLWRVRRARP